MRDPETQASSGLIQKCAAVCCGLRFFMRRPLSVTLHACPNGSSPAQQSSMQNRERVGGIWIDPPAPCAFEHAPYSTEDDLE